ncbi:ADP-ribosylglycohydrolase family protein [Paenibacillus flagellatus]|uniref:Alpha-galactosidase NEW3 domain-containing protein n=1 Tax=Paenibacillus flagellatus TaxID=2211139 RepID=A0A2V5KPP4_9BACL|nr:ADP-ribosylglycohydrolase family protein [Paenibacillus flagellatus]PYI50486.1 hypothetical protein DLM86_28710 [Paenibacillus flagellatus]
MQKTGRPRIALRELDYRDKVYAGWLGKNIGGTLGAPHEGRMEPLDLTFYSSLPDGPLENDDLDLQLVWLHALEQHGARLTAKELAQEWLEHVFFPYDEYGYALTNLRRGLVPPVSGAFNNPFADGMGSPIRSEIWAMVAPASPGIAAQFAYQDAIVDHAGGEGVYGEMLFAAIQSAAFTESDRDRLLDIGLAVIPETCRTAKAVRDLRAWHGQGKSWTEARELVLAVHGSDNFTDTPQNVAFTILGWLYGEHFGDAILKAVNCGYDTDCTGATLGAILGMIGGTAGLPAEWADPVGDRIVVSPPVKGFPAPADLRELTERTMAAAKEVLAVWDTGVSIGPDGEPAAAAGSLSDAGDPRRLWDVPVTAVRYGVPQGPVRDAAVELTVDFGPDGPAIGRGAEKTLVVSLANRSREAWLGSMELAVPEGWRTSAGAKPFELAAGQSVTWPVTVRADDAVRSSHVLAVLVHRDHDGHRWRTEQVPFALVAASRWTVESPGGDRRQIDCAGNRIEFERLRSDGPGIYRASATVSVPSGRPLRLIVASGSPVKAAWNGETIVDSPHETSFMPAYHRAPASQRHEWLAEAGRHRLDVEAVSPDGKPPVVYVLPVAQRSASAPGSNYYYTDVLFV